MVNMAKVWRSYYRILEPRRGRIAELAQPGQRGAFLPVAVVIIRTFPSRCRIDASPGS